MTCSISAVITSRNQPCSFGNLRCEATLTNHEFLYLQGKNGCGKTSLLRWIAGLPSPLAISGRISVDGVDLTTASVVERVRSGIVLTHQVPPKFHYLTLQGLLDAYPSTQSRALLITSLQLEHTLDKPLHHTSGGESKRVELLLTLLLQPKLILLDEIDSGVDPSSLILITNTLIHYLHNHACCGILTSHTRNILTHLPGVVSTFSYPNLTQVYQTFAL